MDTIYRCPDCGYETSDRSMAKGHNCKDLVKVKEIRLECCGYDGRIRFNKETATRDRRFWDITTESIRAWNSGIVFEVCTEDLSEEHEKELKNELLQAAVDYRAARIKELEREIGDLKRRMSHKAVR